MGTGLEGIAAKARRETKLKFTSLCHHITRELIWESLNKIPKQSAPGVDGISVEEAKKIFEVWIEEMLSSIHRKAYKASPVRRVWIPKPGKITKRPLGVPCVADRALQRSVSVILSCIYEQDFLPCSFGGRPKLSAHHALATLNEVIAGKKVSWILEADLKNFFGSLDHGWLLRFVEHRVGDPRIISLIKHWLKAGVLEEGELRSVRRGLHKGVPSAYC
jgi:retron-type reverse transcriptase